MDFNHANRVGGVAELMVAVKAAQSGWTPSIPAYPVDYDLIVERDGVCKRVQVKSVVINKNNPVVHVCKKNRAYADDAFDWIIAVDVDTGKMWRFEWKDVTQRRSLSLRKREDAVW
ncbi:MAG: hypothetical protein AMJ55_00275 [Gammaproteobacteria bacterium SG8_15]|nr:MAG: hypothetical protein AMJ55_00275 [Gammaproteobacteria bacterium SG8_15]